MKQTAFVLALGAALALSGQTPVINTNGVVNAASNSSTGVAAGSIVTIFGTNLSAVFAAASSAPLPTALGGVAVTINGTAVPLFFVSPTQINLQVPWELAGTSSAPLVVTRNSVPSATYTLNLPATAPGIFNFLHGDFSAVSSASPAQVGETVIMLSTGLGPVSNTPASGALAGGNSTLLQTPAVIVGGFSAVVAFSGLASSAVGYNRVDFIVPPVLGTASVYVTAGGNASNLSSFPIIAATNTPAPLTLAAVNGASFAPVTAANGSVSPGAIVSVFGTNLGASIGKYLTAPLSTTLNDVTVKFNGVAAPLFYVSPTQVNVQAPSSTSLGSAIVSVTRTGNTSSAPVTFVGASPGLFTTGQNGSGAAVAFHIDGRLVSPTAPLLTGENLFAFGTGFGALATPVTDGTAAPGSPISTQNAATAKVGGLSSLVLFAGTAPGFVGVNQLNLRVPIGLPTDNGTPFTMTISNVTSNSVTLPVLANGGVISISSLSALAGSTVNVPVMMTLGSGSSASNISFTFGVSASVSSLGFTPGPSLPSPSSLTTSSSSISVGWSGLSPAKSGSILLGTVSFSVPGGPLTLQITVAQASSGATQLNVTPGAAATLQVPPGIFSLGSVQGMSGTSVAIPVNVALAQGVSLDAVAFGVRIDPNIGAPGIGGQLTFVHDPALPVPSATDTSYGPISVFLQDITPAVTGSMHLGDIIVPLPAALRAGQGYTASITGGSASLGNTSIKIGAASPAQVSVSDIYLVGDVFPNVSDFAGNFGDGQVNTVDLITLLRAVAAIPGFVPQTCTDRFDAMDSFPADTTNQRGGDGVLNTLDLIATLRRVSGVDASKPTRIARGTPCSAVAPQSRAPRSSEMYFGEVQHLADNVARFPVYFRADNAVSLTALSFGAGITGQGHAMKFTSADGIPASTLEDNGVSGSLAVAWLSPLALAQGDVLLGYVDVTGANSSTKLHFYGIDVTR